MRPSVKESEVFICMGGVAESVRGFLEQSYANSRERKSPRQLTGQVWQKYGTDSAIDSAIVHASSEERLADNDCDNDVRCAVLRCWRLSGARPLGHSAARGLSPLSTTVSAYQTTSSVPPGSPSPLETSVGRVTGRQRPLIRQPKNFILNVVFTLLVITDWMK